MNPLWLILNGKSAGRPQVRAAVQAARDRGIDVSVHVTWEGGDAARFAADATRGAPPGRRVVAGGGDGTVNEVLNGLLAAPQRLPLAVLPLGTANDFATSAGVPVQDLAAALVLAAEGPVQAVDVGRVNERLFLNVASGGFGAEVTEHTPPRLKNLLGGGAYALTAALLAVTGHPYRGRLEADGQVHEGAMTLMAVGNGRQAGGGALLTPQAHIDDGLLDVLVVPDAGHDRVGHLLADLAQLKHGSSPHFRYLRAASLRVDSDDPLQFNLDGEPLRGTQFRFDLLPGALDLVLPGNSPLLKGTAA